MTAPSIDYYALLGVARNADAREIKRAYFRLIRQRTPESHPEEFKRLREAYEVLHHPESRKEYDELTQYGEEVGGHLRAGMAAMERGDLQAAQREFQAVLSLDEDLHLARDLLGMAYLNNNQAREALVHFDRLVAISGDNATYHLHKGYAHYSLEEYHAAIAAYEQAHAIDPGDTRIIVALADCYTAMERYSEALKELDRAIYLDGKATFQDFVFFMRKVQVHLLCDRMDLADREIDEIIKTLPDDQEIRKYVAQKLSALASQLFRIKRSADANRVLRRVGELLPGSRVGLGFPARVSARLADLPQRSREALSGLLTHPPPHLLMQGLWAGPLLLLLLASGLMLGGMIETFTSEEVWRGNTYAIMAALLAGGPLLFLHALGRIWAVARSSVGRYTTIHSMYLLQTDVDRVTAWPLPNLHDVAMTHHLQNGVYQYTVVKADFAGAEVTVTIRGQQTAVDFAQALLDARHRCLGLLAVGMLDEEEGADILPRELFDRGTRPHGPAVRRALLLRYGAALLSGAALLWFGTARNARSAERRAWQSVQRSGQADGLRHYLLSYPEGAHREEAHQRLARIYEDSRARYLAQAGDAPGAQVILEMLDAVHRTLSHEVRVRYHAQVALEGRGAETHRDGTVTIDAARAFSEVENRRREAILTQRLADMFQRRFSRDVLSITGPGIEADPRDERGGRTTQPSVFLDIAYHISPSGERYRSATGKSALHGIQISWTLSVRTPGGVILTPASTASGQRPFTLKVMSRPARSVRSLRRPHEDDEILPYSRMAESACEELEHRLARELGLGAPGPAAPPERRFSLSPETYRTLGDIARRRNLSPAVLEELLMRRRERTFTADEEGREDAEVWESEAAQTLPR